MKRNLTTLFFATLGLLAQAQAPTADQIIDKYLVAIGGKEAISKIQDLVISATSETPRGTSETEVKIKFPNKFTSSTYMMGNEVSKNISDGIKVSMQSGFMGNQQSRTMEGNEAIMPVLQNNPFPELLYEQYKVVKNVVGQDTVAGKLAWKVAFSLPDDGRKWTESFDIETGLKVKRATNMEGIRRGPMGGGGGNAVFSNYKEIKDGGGVKIPFTREQSFGQFAMKIEVSSVKVNRGLKDNIFEIQ